MPDDAPVAIEEFLREQLSDENVESGADDLLGTPLDEPAVEEPGDEEDTTEASTDTAAIPEPEAEEEQAAEEESTEDTDEVEIKVKGKETSLDALLPKTVHTLSLIHI